MHGHAQHNTHRFKKGFVAIGNCNQFISRSFHVWNGNQCIGWPFVCHFSVRTFIFFLFLWKYDRIFSSKWYTAANRLCLMRVAVNVNRSSVASRPIYQQTLYVRFNYFDEVFVWILESINYSYWGYFFPKLKAFNGGQESIPYLFHKFNATRRKNIYITDLFTTPSVACQQPIRRQLSKSNSTQFIFDFILYARDPLCKRNRNFSEFPNPTSSANKT